MKCHLGKYLVLKEAVIGHNLDRGKEAHMKERKAFISKDLILLKMLI